MSKLNDKNSKLKRYKYPLFHEIFINYLKCFLTFDANSFLLILEIKEL